MHHLTLVSRRVGAIHYATRTPHDIARRERRGPALQILGVDLRILVAVVQRAFRVRMKGSLHVTL